jgi:hypothetical protein
VRRQRDADAGEAGDLAGSDDVLRFVGALLDVVPGLLAGFFEADLTVGDTRTASE